MPHDPYTELVERAPREHDLALAIADRILERPHADPDDDIAVLARQFLRAEERIATAATALARLSAPVTEEEIDKAAEELHKLSNDRMPWSQCHDAYKRPLRIRARAAIAAHRAGRGM